jgi:polyferredoxin
MTLEIVGEILKLTVFAGLALAGILVILIWKKNLTTKLSYLRIFVQITVVVAFFYIFTWLRWFFSLLLAIFIMTIFLGRFFCGWLCPFGLYMDLVTLLRKALRIRYRKLPKRLNRSLHKLRYVILIFFLIVPFLLSPIESWMWPLSLFLSGPFRPLMILLSPLEPLIIPWEGIIGIYGINISFPYVSDIVFYIGENFALIAVSIFLALTLAGSFIFRRFWCRFCPTGASIAIVNKFRSFKWSPVLHINKEEEKCTKCRICERVCPVQVTEVYEQKGGKITTSMCLMCLRCVEMCPYEDCLKVEISGKTIFKSRNWLEPSRIE